MPTENNKKVEQQKNAGKQDVNKPMGQGTNVKGNRGLDEEIGNRDSNKTGNRW